MPNHLLIYVIVALNAACQTMLVWRLKIAGNAKYVFCALTVALPILIMGTMRLMVAVGAIHGRVAEQSEVERFVTTLASMLLIASPLLVTAAAVAYGRKRRRQGMHSTYPDPRTAEL